MTEHTFKSWDGQELFYRRWDPERPADQAVLLLHRGHEHSARWNELATTLTASGVAVFAWDARGHGRSPGDRGSAESLAVMIRDLDSFVRHVEATSGISIPDMVVVAQSVGAVLAAAWVHDYAPRIRALVLAVPAFRVRLYLPLAIPLLRLKQRLFGRGYVKSYVKARMLTHDPGQAADYAGDALIFRQIAVNILLDLYDTSTRVMADAGAIDVPTLVLAAGSDWVVDVAAQRRFIDGLSSPLRSFRLLPNFYHAIYHEKDRGIPIDLTRDFVVRALASPRPDVAHVDADKFGYTAAELDRLQTKSWNPLFPLQRIALKTLGRLSQGIRLGWRSGFDSGVMLDYVYDDRARGWTPFGRWIDRTFLDSVGWRGIRVRRRHLEAALARSIERVHAEGRPVNLLDIASGPGRYDLETIRRYPQIPISARLRDYKTENIEAGRRLAVEFGLSKVEFEQMDAFDPQSYGSLSPRPTIAVISGLFELIPDNKRILAALSGIAGAVLPGGYLVYTNQPWHPQLEFIARVLVNREGNPWVMRRRSQAEMDDLVRSVGFEKLEQSIDGWGIFSVSIARRVGG